MTGLPFQIQLELFGERPGTNWDDRGPPERGLMIRDPYVTEILLHKKSWELRSSPTKFRGRIGLIKSKSGHIFGEAELVDVLGPLSFKELLNNWQIGPHDLEQLSQSRTHPYSDQRGFSRTFAWVLENVVSYQPPIRYRHPPGAITFVNLERALDL